MTEDVSTNVVDDGLIDSVANWLMDRALGDASVENLMEGCCNRLRATGIPLWRAQIGFQTLKPLFSSMTLTWLRDEGVATVGNLHGVSGQSDDWLRSPYFHMLDSGIPFLRRRLTGTDALVHQVIDLLGTYARHVAIRYDWNTTDDDHPTRKKDGAAAPVAAREVATKTSAKMIPIRRCLRL